MNVKRQFPIWEVAFFCSRKIHTGWCGKGGNMKGKEEMRELVDQMYEELKNKLPNLTYETLNRQMGVLIAKKHIGLDITLEELEERKNKNRFSFFSEKEVELAIKSFFADAYTLKRIARECVELDEDDKFCESMETGRLLGRFFAGDGRFQDTSILEVVMKVLPWGKRNPVTGLPFDVTEFRLVRDEERKWSGEKKREEVCEPEFGFSWTQLSLFD